MLLTRLDLIEYGGEFFTSNCSSRRRCRFNTHTNEEETERLLTCLLAYCQKHGKHVLLSFSFFSVNIGFVVFVVVAVVVVFYNDHLDIAAAASVVLVTDVVHVGVCIRLIYSAFLLLFLLFLFYRPARPAKW